MTVSAPVQRGKNELDPRAIAPLRGGIYHLQGAGRVGSSMRKYAEAWCVSTLKRGECVHWIDGASRIDPARILAVFPAGEQSSQDHLHRLFIGRGFTVHQLATLVERLTREVSITSSPLVVIDGPIAMHLDRQVGDHEARCLMRRILNQLRELARSLNVAVIIITAHKGKSKRHQNLLSLVEHEADQHLIEHSSIRRNAPLLLSHKPSGASGMWPNHRPFVTLHQALK